MINPEKIKIFIRIFLLVMTLFVGEISYAAKYTYVYDDTSHYSPSGWMAWDNKTSALSLDTAYPYGAAEGSYCIKMSYDPDAAWWAGFFFQAKGAWRADITETPKGIDLSGYTAVKVQARADADVVGAIKVQFGIGEDGDSCGDIRTDWLSLTTEWQTFTVDISSTTNMTDVNGLFMIAMKDYGNVYPAVYIDDIRFVAPGPAAINDLSSNIGPQPGTIAFSWTAPTGDYDHTGYIVRYSSSDYIHTQSDFDNAVNYNQSWVPAAANTQEQKIIDGLTPGQSYYFAIETVDAAGNRSFLSNICYAVARTNEIGIRVEGNIDLGEVVAGQTAVGLTPISVTNIGGSATTLSIGVTNPAGWMISNSNEKLGEYILLAAFATNYDKIVWDLNNHGLSQQAEKCTTTLFAGDQTGVNMPVNDIRKLWIRFTAPAISDLGTDKQTIFINITANSAN